jgi:hypothetical protein
MEWLSGTLATMVGWFVPLLILLAAARHLPRLIRDIAAGPLPDVAPAPDDAQPMALIVPNDDGLFTWSLILPEGGSSQKG